MSGVIGEETSASRWPMTRTQAFEKARARFGATRTDVNEAAPYDGTRVWGRCKIYRREMTGEVCIGGGRTWELAIADADAFHRGVRS